MAEDSTVLVGLGSCLGDRLAHLRLGVAGLRAISAGPVETSSVWETDPVEAPEAGAFLNAVARFRCDLDPEAVLDGLLAIERIARRVRSLRNAPRTLDLDLLWIEGVTVHSPSLTVPHPRMWSRLFVLEPLAELDPNFACAATGRTVVEELSLLSGQGSLRRLGPLAPPESQPL